MFDSLRDADGDEWQTKAFTCDLDTYRIGDAITSEPPLTYQVKVLGGSPEFIHSYATVQNGVLASVPVPRDQHLPLLDYGGGWIAAAEGI